ncbi:meprin A subunit beta-like isoform X2 [Labeo rohita]|uniref:meprin A subunit beta-like isoform X2 n=1 Tax=Labeo rohita TaxID=84645 RepID=UPI0021E2100B|nr:meprin A subunit beta-like isoform X2 [Labeo rohita]XP_050956840.1 meprin A subunit beta-like isoform X2 [Labeo rohita]XP_050956841.1 meprin A subunit beta-like isoform X2 [Labeo rohita]
MASLHTLLILCVCTTALCLPISSLTGNTKIDVVDGKDKNIFDINGEAGLHLVEGDILIQEGEDRNTILDEKYRWPTTVPYVLDRSLEINAKGVILRAFEQFRLKTCIDFKPWHREPNYIFIFKDKGQWRSLLDLWSPSYCSCGVGCLDSGPSAPWTPDAMDTATGDCHHWDQRSSGGRLPYYLGCLSHP